MPILLASWLKQLDVWVPFIVAVRFADIIDTEKSVSAASRSPRTNLWLLSKRFPCLNKVTWLSAFSAKLVNVESPWIKTIDTQNFPSVLAEISSVAVHQSSLGKVLRHMLIAWKDGNHWSLSDPRDTDPEGNYFKLNPPWLLNLLCLYRWCILKIETVLSLSPGSLFL